MCGTWMQQCVAKKMYNAMDKGYKGTKHKVMQKTNNTMENNCRTQGHGRKIMCRKQKKIHIKKPYTTNPKEKKKPVNLKAYNWNWN